MSFLKISILTLLCLFQFTLSQIMDIRDEVFPDTRTERTVFKSTSREDKIPVRVFEISESEDLSTGVEIGFTYYSRYDLSLRYIDSCPDDLLYGDGEYGYFSECKSAHAVAEINHQLSFLPGAPEEIFELDSYQRIYDADNYNSPDGHAMLNEYAADTSINTPGYLNIIVTNTMVGLGGTTYLYQDLNDGDGGLLIVYNEGMPVVIVRELGHLVGFPHLLGDVHYLETFAGDTIVIDTIGPSCTLNYMSSWLRDDCEFPTIHSIAAGDMNGDGFMDIVVAEQ